MHISLEISFIQLSLPSLNKQKKVRLLTSDFHVYPMLGHHTISKILFCHLAINTSFTDPGSAYYTETYPASSLFSHLVSKSMDLDFFPARKQLNYTLKCLKFIKSIQDKHKLG